MRFPLPGILQTPVATLMLCLGLLLHPVAAEEKGEEAGGRPDFEAMLRENPDDTTALYNLGLMRYLDGKYEDALKHWTRCRKLDPEDWQVHAKIIQALHALGKTEQAEKESAELRAARKSGKNPELAAQKFYIRDQFEAGEFRVMVLEYYELEGERPLALKFRLLKGDESLDRFISLGSYPLTTELMRSQGLIGPKDRGWHLDEYEADGGHKTYGIYPKRPAYPKLRKMVAEILKGERQPESSFSPGTEQPAKEDSPDKKEKPEAPAK